MKKFAIVALAAITFTNALDISSEKDDLDFDENKWMGKLLTPYKEHYEKPAV